jgi:hypothetical protein
MDKVQKPNNSGCFNAVSLLGLIFDSEHRCDMFFRNVGGLPPEYIDILPKKIKAIHSYCCTRLKSSIFSVDQKRHSNLTLSVRLKNVLRNCLVSLGCNPANIADHASTNFTATDYLQYVPYVRSLVPGTRVRTPSDSWARLPDVLY